MQGEAKMNFIAELGAWNWFILAIILVVLESAIPGIYFVWFGLAATLVGFIALATGIDWQWQILIFGVLSFATAFVARRYATPRNAPSDQPGLNQRGSYYIGRIVTVADPIRNGRGRIRLGDTLWIAEGPDLDQGAQARIIKLEGTVVIVEPIES